MAKIRHHRLRDTIVSSFLGLLHINNEGTVVKPELTEEQEGKLLELNGFSKAEEVEEPKEEEPKEEPEEVEKEEKEEETEEVEEETEEVEEETEEVEEETEEVENPELDEPKEDPQEEEFTEDQLKKMTVPELKKLAEKRNIDLQAHIKNDIIEEILNALK